MGVWDKKIAPKWGGTANAQFRFSVSYCLFGIKIILEMNCTTSSITATVFLFFCFFAIAGLKAITGSANRFIQVPSIEAFSEAAAWSLLVKVCEEAIVGSNITF